ncbi:MAG: hypothetical protein JWQ49_1915 [Edaphobacter sp.]|nr:hypothetical protein [Edaphobacter sp.]
MAGQRQENPIVKWKYFNVDRGGGGGYFVDFAAMTTV